MSNHEAAGVKEGDILAGKYRVDRVLGSGGMGVVVAAHHLDLDDRVAIKLLLPETLNNKEAVSRFSREARAAVKVKSEHVARVTDVGTLPSGAPYMVMEYLEGIDLAGWLVQRGPLPLELAVDFVLQACEAIAEAHSLGIVHRDLKPANLFLARLPGGGQTIKVLDFGISKLTGLSGSSGTSATKTSALMGSPLYMSPEQMRSTKSVDSTADIWSIGVILYELVSGKSPFLAETMPELVFKVTNESPAPLRNLRPDAPPGLEPVILRCLERDRSLRYATIGELASDLAPFGSPRASHSVDRITRVMEAAGMSSKAPLKLPGSAAPARTGSDTFTEFGSTRSGSKRPHPVVYAVAGLVAGGVVAGFIVLRGSSAPADSGPLVGAETITKSAIAPVAAPPEAPTTPAPAAPAQSAVVAPVVDPEATESVAKSEPPEPAKPPPTRVAAKRSPPPTPAGNPVPAPAPAASAKKQSPGSLIQNRY